METRDDLSSALQRKKLEFTYDYRSRRALKADQNGDGSAGRLSHLDSHAALAQSRPAKRGNLEGDSPKGGNGSGWVQVEDLRFIYDGWNLVAELNDQGDPVRTHVWGTDLSDTGQGAGGVGGLLWSEVREGTGSELYYMAYDGNGSVMGVVSESDGTLSAAFEYSPFGVLLVVEGEAADDLPFRFSTKYEDADTGYLYNGYRYYSPTTGRWLNRDPIEEEGGMNLYGFVRNNPLNLYDSVGLWTKPERDGEAAWAYTCAEEGDTWESLAKMLKLDVGEIEKWLNNYENENEPLIGKRYEIPNTVVVYTSKQNRYDEINPLPFADLMRWMAERSGRNYESKGYRVLTYLNQASDDKFISLWETEGIFAFAFGGHGNRFGFAADPGSGTPVNPSEVTPLYKLQAIGAYSCFSANPMKGQAPVGSNRNPLVSWRSLVDPNGTFVGYWGWVNWLNALFDEEAVNPGAANIPD